ncbi:VanW family protein [Patescibacteria group bacterium]|nr:VanW family protein [Patescibacteria group bacterium]
MCIKILGAIVIGIFTVVLLAVFTYEAYNQKYREHVFPTVSVGNIPFGGKTPEEVQAYWLGKNQPFEERAFTFTFEGETATISGTDLNLGYDATLSATQAYLVGRSGNLLTDLFVSLIPYHTNLSPYFRWDDGTLTGMLADMSDSIDIPVQNALFAYKNGRVTSFKPSRNGRRVNIAEAKKRFTAILASVPHTNTHTFTIPLPVDVIHPAVTTDGANTFGIREKIGEGYSEFAGSAEERIHNIVLAATKINGILVRPGDTFSLDDALGDISAATGFQPAYIIQNGRTILGDGGGVCQVSTTLFRAALNAGLPIVERHAHAYRVHYYEEGGYKPGIDATVFAPSVDFKFKNDTPGYILIQTVLDLRKPSLTFNLYGTGDGRQAEILDQRLWAETPPPPDLFQDDPTIPAGIVKQVDFAAWGAKASFRYRVTRNGQTIEDETFNSNYQPWQAVYLKGTK